MDDIDRKILKILQDNARTSLKTIAEKTYLSSPAVSARIEKLEKSTGLDVRTFDDALTFKIAMMVVNYMKYLDSLNY